MAVLLALVLPTLAHAETPEEFYRGKTVTMVASTGTGQGLDLGARMVARYFAAHLPGKPGIVNKNMPGAGHVLAANYLANEAPRDGTVVLATLGAIVLHQMLDGRGVRYDVNKFGWVGSSDTSNQTIYVWHTSVKSIEEARSREVLMGGTGSGSYTVLYPTLMNHLAGTKFRIVAGYPTGNEVHLAMQRGEVEGRAGNHFTALKVANPDWVRDRLVTLLVQIGLEPDPQMPGVPMMQDFAKDDQGKRIFELFESDGAIGATFLTTPDVPADRLAALRTAFTAAMNDPGYRAEAAKVNMDVTPADGAKIQAIVGRVTASSPELIAKAKQAMEEDGVIGPGAH